MAHVAIRTERLRLLVSIALLVIALVGLDRSPAHAQTVAQATGVVVDQNGAALPGARVVVSDAKGAAVQSVTTDAAGAFSIRGLAVGTYSIRIELNSFTAATETL